MASVTITFNDDDDGCVSISIASNPEADLDGPLTSLSGAQALAVQTIDILTEKIRDSGEAEMVEFPEIDPSRMN